MGRERGRSFVWRKQRKFVVPFGVLGVSGVGVCLQNPVAILLLLRLQLPYDTCWECLACVCAAGITRSGSGGAHVLMEVKAEGAHFVCRVCVSYLATSQCAEQLCVPAITVVKIVANAEDLCVHTGGRPCT